MTTAYTVLGIERAATHEEIAAAYRRKAREHHPDRGGDTRAMARVNLAWQKIGTPEARAAYDLHLRDLERAKTENAEADASASFDPAASAKEARERSVEASRLVAEIAQQQGLVDAAGAERMRATGGKAADVARGVVELIGMVRGR